MSTSKKSLALSAFTVVSRILGLVRDRFQAVFFGTGPIASAWEIAYMLPNMLRNLLAEGVLSQSFIPVYSDELKRSKEEAALAAGTLLVFLFVLLSFIVLAGIFIFPFVLPIINNHQPNSGFLVELAQLLFVFILFASLTAILMGISQTHNRFFVPALSPVLLNAVFIAGYFFLMQKSWSDLQNAKSLAFIVIIGGSLQLALQLAWVYWNGIGPKFAFNFNHPIIKKIFLLMAPAVLGASMFQLNQLSDVMIASWFIPMKTGAIPALRFSHRLIQLPTGIIGVAIATVILPALTKSIRNADNKQSEELKDAIQFSLFLTVPAGIGLFFLGKDIINLIYFGGKWTLDSTIQTNSALIFFSIGVPFFSLNKILTSTYYAYKDTKTPVKILLFMVMFNFCLNLILVQFFMQGGIALSTSITSILSVFFLIFHLNKKGIYIAFKEVRVFTIKSGILWIVTGSVLFIWTYIFSNQFYEVVLQSRFIEDSIQYKSAFKSIFGILLVLFIYFPGAWILNLEEFQIIVSLCPNFIKQWFIKFKR